MTFPAPLLARLTMFAALILPPLLFYPRAEHGFWAMESASSLLFAWLAFFFSSLSASNEPNPVPVPRGGFWLALAFFLWLLVSALFSLRPDLGIEAWLRFLCYPFIFISVWVFSYSTPRQNMVLAAILSAGFVMALYGLSQFLGFEWFVFSSSFGTRASSFLGNPNFLGGHMAMLAPLALGLFLSSLRQDPLSSSGARTRGLGILFVLFLLCLLATGTRGAVLGAGLGITTLLALNAGTLPWLLKRRPVAILALGCLVGMGSCLFLRNPEPLRRLWSLREDADSSLVQRGSLFSNSLKLASGHPFLGVGPGNFRIFYPSVQASDISVSGPHPRPYVYTEHSHNDLLQMAAESGFPGALLWLALCLWFYSRLWKSLKNAKPSECLLLSGLGAGCLALNIHGLFNFPFLILPTQMTAWALAALALRRGEEREGKSKIVRPGFFRQRNKLVLVVLGAVCLAAGFWAQKPLFSDSLWWVGKGLQSPENDFQWGAAGPVLSKAVRLAPREDRLWYLLGLSQIHLEQLPQAESSLDRVVALNPFYSEARLRLGKIRLELGKADSAETALAPMENYAPNFLEMWEPLAASRFRQRKFALALETYDRALILQPGFQVLLENQAACLGSLGRFDEALAGLDRMLAREPKSVNAHLSKAITYIKMNRKREARLSLKKVIELQPDHEYAQKLLKNLK